MRCPLGDARAHRIRDFEHKRVKIRGGNWMYYAYRHYRGHQTIDAVRDCIDTEWVKRVRGEDR